MKNITIKSLTAVALLASLSSCSDFLDQSSPSSLDGKNIFSTYEYAQGTIANIYQEFGEQNYRARAIWYGYNTDNQRHGKRNRQRCPYGVSGGWWKYICSSWLRSRHLLSEREPLSV